IADETWRVWLERLGAGFESFREGIGSARDRLAEWQSLARVGQPVEPFAMPGFLGPIVALTAALAGLWLAGTAVVSLAALLAALLGLGFILTQVFGISIELAGAPSA